MGTFQVLIPATRRFPVHIYEATGLYAVPGEINYFSIPVYEDLVPNSFREGLSWKVEGGVKDGRRWTLARSKRRPPITLANPELVDHLVKELARLDALNTPRDSVFDGRDLIATVGYNELPPPVPEGWMTHRLVLQSVMFRL